jgi:hypothetical protein
MKSEKNNLTPRKIIAEHAFISISALIYLGKITTNKKIYKSML